MWWKRRPPAPSFEQLVEQLAEVDRRVTADAAREARAAVAELVASRGTGVAVTSAEADRGTAHLRTERLEVRVVFDEPRDADQVAALRRLGPLTLVTALVPEEGWPVLVFGGGHWTLYAGVRAVRVRMTH